MTTPLSVIDLSHHNTVNDFGQVRAAGIVGILHKCTEGTTIMDNTYLERQEAAEAAGLAWGAYHYLHHGNIDAQIDYFLANANLLDGSRVVIDFEDPDCTLDDLLDAVDAIHVRDGNYQITVYSGSLIKQLLGNDYNGTLASETSLWLAQYTEGTPTWPKTTWPNWTLWQFTDEASVSGISGDVDGNRFNGSEENLLKWFGPVEMAPVPPHPENLVVISIQTPPKVDLMLVVNGRVLT